MVSSFCVGILLTCQHRTRHFTKKEGKFAYWLLAQLSLISSHKLHHYIIRSKRTILFPTVCFVCLFYHYANSELNEAGTELPFRIQRKVLPLSYFVIVCCLVCARYCSLPTKGLFQFHGHFLALLTLLFFSHGGLLGACKKNYILHPVL